ncbi:hypothetical protein SE17_26215, partial [Kouleothrix aurantiaca]
RGYGRYFYGPIDDLVNINDLLQQAAAAGRRIFEVLDAEVTVADAPNAQPLPAPLRGDIRFENVRFGYDPARPVLHEVNLHIQPGERVALGGHEGPIHDLPARIAEIEASHQRKLARVHEACATPHTISELSKQLYPNVGSYDILLALEEIGAHVEYLDQRGELAIANLPEVAADERIAPRYCRL